MKARLQSIMLLRNDEQQIVANGYPYLRVDGVTGRSIEVLDVQVLLNPFEEQLNLPPLPIKFRDSKGINGEVVGNEAIDLSVSKVFIDNKSKVVRILAGGLIPRQAYRFIGNQTGLRIHLSRLDNRILHIVLGSSHKPGVLLMKVLVERVKFHISFVHEVIRVGLDGYLFHNLGIVDRRLCKTDKGWDGTVQINHRMHLDSAFSVMKCCPGAQRQAELDCTAVEGTNHFLKIKSKRVALIQFFSLMYQHIAKALVYPPILLLVRFRKGRSRDNLQPRPVQVLRTETKSSLNISQSAPIRKLGKTHRHKLVTASEFDGVPVAFVALDTLGKFIFGEERHKLREDCFTLVHGLRGPALVSVCKLTSSNRKIIFAL